MISIIKLYRGCSSAVSVRIQIWRPWVWSPDVDEAVWGTVFLSPPCQLLCWLACACPPPPPPPPAPPNFMCMACTQICAHVKIPYHPSVVKLKEFGSQLVVWKHENTAHRTGKKLGSTLLWLLAFPGESSSTFPCIALGQDSYLI